MDFQTEYQIKSLKAERMANLLRCIIPAAFVAVCFGVVIWMFVVDFFYIPSLLILLPIGIVSLLLLYSYGKDAVDCTARIIALENRPHPYRRIFWKFLPFLLAAAAVAGYFIYRNHQQDLLRAEKRAEFEAALKAIEKEYTDYIGPYYYDFKYVTDVKAKVTHQWDLDYNKEGTPCYTCDQIIVVTVYADNSFHGQTDNGIYESLRTIHSVGESAYYDIMKRHFPAYYNASYELLEDWYKGYFTNRNVCEYIVRTSSHTYEYARNVRDYFVRDGKDVYLESWRKKYAVTPTPTPRPASTVPKTTKPSSGSSKKKTYYDAYDADDYDDAEDYADEYWEEFDEDFDEGWEEAYDYWMEEHGGY